MDQLDRNIINQLQQGFPICDSPFAQMAASWHISEAELIARIDNLLTQGVLSRFGPMYHAERMGGSLSLTAMKIPPEDFARVADIVNAMPEVAHNYQREHLFNMWFVLATETAQQHQQVLANIEQQTGYKVYDMPKIKEYFVGLQLSA